MLYGAFEAQVKVQKSKLNSIVDVFLQTNEGLCFVAVAMFFKEFWHKAVFKEEMRQLGCDQGGTGTNYRVYNPFPLMLNTPFRNHGFS